MHGTTITLLNAGRQYLGLHRSEDLAGQALRHLGPRRDERRPGQGGGHRRRGRRHRRGQPEGAAEAPRAGLGRWRSRTTSTGCSLRIERARESEKPLSLGYLGNVVDLWERLAGEAGVPVELGSDQTSLHNPYARRLLPGRPDASRSRTRMMAARPRAASGSGCRSRCGGRSRRSTPCAARGMHFWDYGNAFLLEASRAGAERHHAARRQLLATRPTSRTSWGPMCFDYGFGPFRWVCTVGRPARTSRRPTASRPTCWRAMAADAPARDPAADARQPALDPAGGGEPAGGRLAGAHPLRRRGRADRHRRWPSTTPIRDGRISAPDRARPRPPRRLGHRLPVPRDREHPRRQQLHAPTWRCTTSSATRSAAPPGSPCTTAAASAGAR